METMPEEIKTLATSHESSIARLSRVLMQKIIADVTELMFLFQQTSGNNHGS